MCWFRRKVVALGKSSLWSGSLAMQSWRCRPATCAAAGGAGDAGSGCAGDEGTRKALPSYQSGVLPPHAAVRRPLPTWRPQSSVPGSWRCQSEAAGSACCRCPHRAGALPAAGAALLRCLCLLASSCMRRLCCLCRLTPVVHRPRLPAKLCLGSPPAGLLPPWASCWASRCWRWCSCSPCSRSTRSCGAFAPGGTDRHAARCAHAPPAPPALPATCVLRASHPTPPHPCSAGAAVPVSWPHACHRASRRGPSWLHVHVPRRFRCRCGALRRS